MARSIGSSRASARRVEILREDAARWAQEHKVQAAMGRNPKAKDIAAAEQNLAKVEKADQALKTDRQLFECAKEKAKEYNAQIAEAKEKRKELEPAYQLTEKLRDVARSERFREEKLERKLGLDRGRGIGM